jgi:hypothetical protein
MTHTIEFGINVHAASDARIHTFYEPFVVSYVGVYDRSRFFNVFRLVVALCYLKVGRRASLEVFRELYGLETVSLRYFNVFVPRQDPSSEYSV